MPKRTAVSIQEETVDYYLRALDAELTKNFRGAKPVRIMIIGGTYMLLEVKNRHTTQDIDVVLMDFADTTDTTSNDENSKAFQEAVKAVARQLHLPRYWLNDDASLWVRGFAPNPQAVLWKCYTKLHVYLPSKRCILALKLMSYRPKDTDDVEVLCQQLGISTYEQAQELVNEFVPERAQREYRLSDTLDELFE